MKTECTLFKLPTVEQCSQRLNENLWNNIWTNVERLFFMIKKVYKGEFWCICTFKSSEMWKISRKSCNYVRNCCSRSLFSSIQCHVGMYWTLDQDDVRWKNAFAGNNFWKSHRTEKQQTFENNTSQYTSLKVTIEFSFEGREFKTTKALLTIFPKIYLLPGWINQ